ncbi:MAG TPA: hypothetical protein VMT76_15240 [Puia sp.]|nr:hypothetical protein [Puia sp.]
MKGLDLTKFYAALIILVSAIASWLIDNVAVNYDRMELGALANLFVPPIIGFVSLILFLLLDWRFPKARFWVTIIFVVINLFIGIEIRYECCIA